MKPLFLTCSASHLVLSILCSVAGALLVFGPGQIAVIPSWQVEHVPNDGAGDDPVKLSAIDFDDSDWYTIGSKGTLWQRRLDSDDDDDEDFYSHNLAEFEDDEDYLVPFYYRAKFNLTAERGSYFQIKTNGISSKADIFFNGVLIADKSVQAGAYVGLTYDVTKDARNGTNVLLIKVYPTDYNRDFALGFVDWNPSPPDNGTGIWREVEVKQTKALSFTGIPRVNTELLFSHGEGIAKAFVKVDVKNLGNQRHGHEQGGVACTIVDPEGNVSTSKEARLNITVGAVQPASLQFEIHDPAIWFPKQWGLQPLYSVSCEVTVNDEVSDSTPLVRFGIRTVTSSLNQFNDTTFFVNGHPFQVIGAGYTSDIFLRFNETILRAQFQYVLDMGLNTVRLEGKQEHPRLYELADEMGIMIMAGWECCDKWEGWSDNYEGSGIKWTDPDYAIANASMRHEAEMMQHHPSMLAFLAGSDFWPDDRATQIYVDALEAFDWDVPIIASASQRGFPDLLGNSGMKMDGPYDWVPPNYWYTDKLGAAFGFGSELGAGVGTPELGSLKRFLDDHDLDDLWMNPKKGLYHMSTEASSFHTRTIYNEALWARYGPPTSLENYLLKAQLMDYEATRAQFEAYAAKWTAERPATGMIYWMLNNAWPSLHWNLFDYYLHPAGSYFGAKTGARKFHVAYDYLTRSTYIINRSLFALGPCSVDAELLDLNGTVISHTHTTEHLAPSNSVQVLKANSIGKTNDVAFLKLTLRNEIEILSRNVYHLSSQLDELDFDNSTWYHTPVTRFADFTALNRLPQVDLDVTTRITRILASRITTKVKLQNRSKVPAVFIRLNLLMLEETWQGRYDPIRHDCILEPAEADILPVIWSDNYVTLWPYEELDVEVEFEFPRSAHRQAAMSPSIRVNIDGWNVKNQTAGIDLRAERKALRIGQ